MTGPENLTILYNPEGWYELWSAGRRRARANDVLALISLAPDAEIDDTAAAQHAYELGFD